MVLVLVFYSCVCPRLVRLLYETEVLSQDISRVGSISAIVASSLDVRNPVCLDVDVDADGCPGAAIANRGALYSIDLDWGSLTEGLQPTRRWTRECGLASSVK
ncbi:hypothetical protein M440DRAFT_1404791 [Trichoderma longibrachiatum ATCC 18648]|uniref:Uncharacterized protein n=1 Tax=Trichoderma longibrachiatum ATCC 18648 TaxID=983965 RepID=A0A2T4BUT4_TRILO|nr:hypothetical protein M440DRAFT_1404791 [Trichoderma longibrachiatum ATCC 18648]